MGMERHSYRIALFICLFFLTTFGLKAQRQDSLRVTTFWVGLELPSTIAHPVVGGYSFQPMVLFNFSQFATAWAGGGVLKTTRDTVFNNLYDYSSQGWYVKAGIDLNLNFNPHRATGFRLGAGVNFARFTEKGELRFQYHPSLFSDSRPGNVYKEVVENRIAATAFEFRQGLFIDMRRLGLLFQIQASLLLRKPDNSDHPTYYIPGLLSLNKDG